MAEPSGLCAPGPGGAQRGPSVHCASQNRVMEHDGAAQASGEGAVPPLRLSAAATCVSGRRDYSREVTGSFDELISHPSPPVRKHLESCSVTFPPVRLAGSLLGTTVSIPHCLRLLVPYWSPAWNQSKAGETPCLTLTPSSISSLPSSFSLSVGALIPSYLLALFSPQRRRFSLPPSPLSSPS